MNFDAETITEFDADGRAWAVVEGECLHCGPRVAWHHDMDCGTPLDPPAALVEHDRECPECGGTSGPDWNVPTCSTCKGTGMVHAAEQETPLQRASREVTEQQDAAAEQGEQP